VVYPRQRSNLWYLKRRPYQLFMLREFSSIFIAGYTVLLVILALKVHNGAGSFADFVQTLRSPWLIAFNIVALLAALLHTATWFLAVPSALQLRIGEEKVEPRLLIGAAYGGMLFVSAVLLAIFLV
jgi:fumarate reductase subunit C